VNSARLFNNSAVSHVICVERKTDSTLSTTNEGRAITIFLRTFYCALLSESVCHAFRKAIQEVSRSVGKRELWRFKAAGKCQMCSRKCFSFAPGKLLNVR
jgi:hypothetical protein